MNRFFDEAEEYVAKLSEFEKREKELLEQLKELKEENEIIKKATHFFMKNAK